MRQTSRKEELRQQSKFCGVAEEKKFQQQKKQSKDAKKGEESQEQKKKYKDIKKRNFKLNVIKCYMYAIRRNCKNRYNTNNYGQNKI